MLQQKEILEASLGELLDMAVSTLGCDENKARMANGRPIKIKFGIGRSVYARAFGFRMMDYFNDPEIALTVQLKWKLFNFHVLQDDAEFDALVGVDFSTAYEPSMFGLESLFEEGKEPTYGKHVIEEQEDLDSLALPDFHTSGLMPRTHAMYRDLQTLVKDRLEVFFPGWARGPWSIATMIRGFNELFINCADDPDYVHRLMRYIVDSRISWEKQRCEFLGISPGDTTKRWMYCLYRKNYSSDLFEDEVDGALFSPAMYHELIVPYQRALSDFYGGIGYYHSCGNLTGFLDDVKTLNVLFMQHISGWTDFKKAAEVMPPHVTLQVSLNATDDVLLADGDHMRARLRSIVENSMGRTVDICPDALYEGGWDTIEKVGNMCRIFKEIYG